MKEMDCERFQGNAGRLWKGNDFFNQITAESDVIVESSISIIFIPFKGSAMRVDFGSNVHPMPDRTSERSIATIRTIANDIWF